MDIQKARSEFNFRSVARKVKVIDDGGRGIVVPKGKGRHVVESIRSRKVPVSGLRFTQQDFRALQRYMVNIRERDFDFLRGHGLVSELLPNLDVYVIDIAQYDKYLGVMKPDQTPAMEEFFL